MSAPVMAPAVVVQRPPDGWTHIGGPGMHLLIALEEDDDLTLAASDAADGGDLDDVIDVLTTGGMRAAHHFVGVHWLPTTRIVAFGPVSTKLTLTDGTEQEVRAGSRRVWTNLDLNEHPERVELRVLDEEELNEAAETAPTPSSEHSAPAASPRTIPTFGPKEDGAAGAARTAGTWGRSWATPAVPPSSEVARPGLPAWGSGPALTPLRAAAAPESTWAARPTEQEEQGSAAPGSDPTPPPVDESDQPALPPGYDYLFGHTVTVDEHRKILAGLAVETQEEPVALERADEVAPVPAQPVAADAEQRVPVARTEQPPTPLASGGLIASVPWARSASTESADGTVPQPEPTRDVPSFSGRLTPPPAPSLLPASLMPPAVPVVSPPAEERDSVDGMVEGTIDGADEQTVDRSALLQARLAAREGRTSGPSVLAVLCSQGHPTPPHSDSCRLCGGRIPSQEPFTMPRPSLGTLRLSTGDVVTLDRSVLLGRAPKLPEGVAVTDRPHVVQVPSPERDVSRNHVVVILEGWHVLVRDLATTNGTTVALPGEPPVRLRADDQQVLEPGSVVSLADEVSFTFDPGAP